MILEKEPRKELLAEIRHNIREQKEYAISYENIMSKCDCIITAINLLLKDCSHCADEAIMNEFKFIKCKAEEILNIVKD